MGKNPAFQIYPGDCRRDTGLQMMDFFSRGIWYEMLWCMWDAPERGKLEGTHEQLSRLIGCSIEELKIALGEIGVTKTGEVTVCNDLVTVINRRMYREEKERQLTRKRVQRFREKQGERISNGDITLPSSSSTSSSKKKESIKKKEKPPKTLFLDSVYLTEDEYQKLKEKHGESLTSRAIEILNNYIQSKGKRYKSHYHTLLGWPIEKAKEELPKSTYPKKNTQQGVGYNPKADYNRPQNKPEKADYDAVLEGIRKVQKDAKLTEERPP